MRAPRKVMKLQPGFPLLVVKCEKTEITEEGTIKQEGTSTRHGRFLAYPGY